MRENMVEIISVAGIIGLAVVSVALVMALLNVDVPDWLSMAVGTVVGYFYSKFNGKNGDKKEG